MFRKLFALLPFAACLVASADASALPFDVYGTGSEPEPQKIAPSSHCQSLMLSLADVPQSATAARRYRFTGTCTINTAPENKAPKMKTLNVLVDAEYSPLMKRASERVVVQDPDFGSDLSTWATCPTDPFVGTNVTCTDKGMGANKWDKYINKEDAPFARQRATSSQVTAAVSKWSLARQKGAAPGAFWQTAKLASLSPMGQANLGENSQVIMNVSGGAGYCPAELDYGDGKKDRVILWSPNIGPFQHVVEHRYAQKGTFKVTVRSLPGCTGDANVSALVK